MSQPIPSNEINQLPPLARQIAEALLANKGITHLKIFEGARVVFKGPSDVEPTMFARFNCDEATYDALDLQLRQICGIATRTTLLPFEVDHSAVPLYQCHAVFYQWEGVINH